MQTILIDTDIAIDYLRGVKETMELMVPLWQEKRAYMSVLSVYELYAGMREKEQNNTDNFINACTIEPVVSEIAKKAGELYRQHRAKGVTLTSIDCLIAATAIINRHKIITRNTAHYPDKTLLYV